jgi:hypothetical protein
MEQEKFSLKKEILFHFLYTNLIKEAILLFPETPGAVILYFRLFVNQQYFFISKTSASKHPHQQAKTGASSPYNNVIV